MGGIVIQLLPEVDSVAVAVAVVVGVATLAFFALVVDRVLVRAMDVAALLAKAIATTFSSLNLHCCIIASFWYIVVSFTVVPRRRGGNIIPLLLGTISTIVAVAVTSVSILAFFSLVLIRVSILSIDVAALLANAIATTLSSFILRCCIAANFWCNNVSCKVRIRLMDGNVMQLLLGGTLNAIVDAGGLFVLTFTFFIFVVVGFLVLVLAKAALLAKAIATFIFVVVRFLVLVLAKVSRMILSRMTKAALLAKAIATTFSSFSLRCIAAIFTHIAPC